MVPSESLEQTEYYGYVLELELYNSSSEPKIMRNIELLFLNGKRILKETVPRDDALTIRRQHYSSFYDVEPINIPPKTVLRYKLENGFHDKNNGLSFIWETTSIIMRYTNEKDKVKKVPIKSEIYRNYFNSHKQEDKPND